MTNHFNLAVFLRAICEQCRLISDAAFDQGAYCLLSTLILNQNEKKNERGSYVVWEINMGAYPRLEFDNIMLFSCLGYDFYIYGAFEILCNSIANL